MDASGRIILLSAVIYATVLNPGNGLQDSSTLRCIVGAAARRYLKCTFPNLSRKARCAQDGHASLGGLRVLSSSAHSAAALFP